MLYYIGGRSKTGKLISVAIGITSNPDVQLAALQESSPFHDLSLLALEDGSQERLEQIKREHHCFGGPWFTVTAALERHISELPAYDASKRTIRRVSVDLDPEEWLALEVMVEELGEKMKSKVVRRALRFYRALLKYKAQGFLVQAVRGGELHQFPKLDAIRGPNE